MAGLIEEVIGSTLVLTIDRHPVRNALDGEVAGAIASALDRLDGEASLLVGILTGAGGVFSSGMDLKAFGEGDLPMLEGRGLAGFVDRPPRKPLIAAVEGYALAGGLEVALACDLIVAARDAVFGIPEVKRGLIAAAGGLVRLPRRLSPNVAMEMALTGGTIEAERAHSLGLVNQLTPPGKALDRALALATQIAENSPQAVRASKEIIRLSTERSERDAREAQEALAARIAASEDAQEGARAFVEKRAAIWGSG